jgi:protein-S-isoprenylcysteine O-methyltransferase Ste14
MFVFFVMTLYGSFFTAGLLLTSLAIYGRAMRRFFSKPGGDNTGMKLIRALGVVSAILHLGAIAVTPNTSAMQFAAGFALYVFGLGLFLWTIRTHGQIPVSAAFSPDCPSRLVSRGPYRFVRHPFYLAYMLTWTAGYISTGRLFLLPTIAAMAVVYARAARVEEEKFAHSSLAAAYASYRASTGTFFPNPFKLMRNAREEENAAGVAQSRA